MTQFCPLCHKPTCVTGSGPVEKIRMPYGGLCRCGGVPALIAERDQLRKLLKHTFSLWVTGAPTSKNTQTRDEILAAIMQKPLAVTVNHHGN
jgi:hypothetical protein